MTTRKQNWFVSRALSEAQTQSYFFLCVFFVGLRLYVNNFSVMSGQQTQSCEMIKQLRDLMNSAIRGANDTSLVMRKPAFGKCENKNADQLRGNPEADQRLCFRYIDSTIPLLPKSNFKPLDVFCGCTARFVSDLV